MLQDLRFSLAAVRYFSRAVEPTILACSCVTVQLQRMHNRADEGRCFQLGAAVEGGVDSGQQ